MHLAMLCACAFPLLHQRKRLFRNREKEKRVTPRFRVTFIYMIKMKISGKEIPTPSEAEMMTLEYGTCVMSLYFF